ncbi:hypothetical protein [Azospirillum aestuarii]|uniref:hypothetical protein n=1 Tax=Azospirillum aestuarii TaxID=2802052 RepID=UPI003CE58D07
MQLALLHQSGRALAQVEEPIDPLVDWIAKLTRRSASLRMSSRPVIGHRRPSSTFSASRVGGSGNGSSGVMMIGCLRRGSRRTVGLPGISRSRVSSAVSISLRRRSMKTPASSGRPRRA